MIPLRARIMAIFLDTNILVYAHDVQAGDRHAKARDLVLDFWRRDEQPSVSTQVLQELYNALRKKGIRAQDAREAVEDYTKWPVVGSDARLVLAAAEAVERWQIHLYDALILEAARRAGATTVYSEDMGDGQDYGGVRVVNPLN